MANGSRPRVGEPRLYDGEEIPVLYPGERAHCAEWAVVEDATDAQGRRVRRARAMRWMVEPEPGVRAACRRWRYRLLGQWVDALRARPGGKEERHGRGET